MKVTEKSAKNFGTALFILFGLAVFSYGQQPRATATPTLIVDNTKKEMPVAAGNNLYCAGYIQNAPVNTSVQIVGSTDEREQNVFAQGDYLYINRGEAAGARVGDVYSVIRPRGKFKSSFSKKGRLGIYVREVGAVEIVKVSGAVSVARVKTSCDNFLLGDLLQPMETRVSPLFRQRPPLDLLGDSSGKAAGRIVLARDARETPSREDIVYIDLGREDNVQVGDYLTIFRPLGKGGVLNSNEEEIVSGTVGGFGSQTFKGGEFSNQSPRKSGSEADGSVVTSRDAKRGRPQNLRRVVGEMVILNVQERTATAVITRAAQEIHTGDMVEVQ